MAKRATYRLQPLLRIKTRAKHLAEVALARALLALKEAREREKVLVRERDEIAKRQVAVRGEMSERMREGGIVQDGNVYVRFLRKLKEDAERKTEEIEDQRKQIARCEELAGRRRRDYIDAAKQLQIMEKHRELWAKKVAAALSREEEKQFDELGNTIHQLRQWRGESQDERQTLGY